MTPNDIRSLWALLGQTWGSRFLEQYGTEPNDAWRAGLHSVAPEAAKYALRQLINSGSPFPPTLPEFIAWARKFRPAVVRTDANGRPYLGDEPEVVRLESRQVDPETAKKNIQKLRETLRGL